MNEFVLAEFVFSRDGLIDGYKLLGELGDDFVLIGSAIDIEAYPSSTLIVSGKLSSSMATVIKLGNSALSDAMRVSYIPDELKNKYRR